MNNYSNSENLFPTFRYIYISNASLYNMTFKTFNTNSQIHEKIKNAYLFSICD